MKGELFHIKKVGRTWGTVKLPEFMLDGLYFLGEVGDQVISSKSRRGSEGA